MIRKFLFKHLLALKTPWNIREDEKKNVLPIDLLEVSILVSVEWESEGERENKKI